MFCSKPDEWNCVFRILPEQLLCANEMTNLMDLMKRLRLWCMMLWTDDCVMLVSFVIWQTVLRVPGARQLNVQQVQCLCQRCSAILEIARLSVWCSRCFTETSDQLLAGNAVIIVLVPYPFSTLRTSKTLCSFYNFFYQQYSIMHGVMGIVRSKQLMSVTEICDNCKNW